MFFFCFFLILPSVPLTLEYFHFHSISRPPADTEVGVPVWSFWVNKLLIFFSAPVLINGAQWTNDLLEILSWERCLDTKSCLMKDLIYRDPSSRASSWGSDWDRLNQSLQHLIRQHHGSTYSGTFWNIICLVI